MSIVEDKEFCKDLSVASAPDLRHVPPRTSPPLTHRL